MLAGELAIFLVLVAIGAMIQSITGFAMGLIIMGGVTAIGVAEISFSAAVVSLISMVNTTVALRHTYKFVAVDYWRRMIMGLVPMTVVGVVALELLSTAYYEWLRALLGLVIIGAGSLLMIQPLPRRDPAAAAKTVGIGCAGGLIGGLYGAGGAPLAWFMYREPLEIHVVRSTLLATFLVSTTGRTIVVTVTGGMTSEILLIAAISVPVVIIVTVLATRFAHRVPDRLVRRVVFVLLVLLGVSLVLR